MKHCKSCAFWKRSTRRGGAHQGFCQSEKMTYTGEGETPRSDGMGYWDCESCFPGIEMGEDFGCVHHHRKPLLFQRVARNWR